MEEEAKYIENIKISRLDYLTAVEFVLGQGIYNKKLIIDF